MEFLKRFPEYNSFVAQRHDNSGSARQQVPATKPETTETPEELIEESYQELRSGLADELLEHVRSCSPGFFEKLVIDLLVAMGYGGSWKDASQALALAEAATRASTGSSRRTGSVSTLS